LTALAQLLDKHQQRTLTQAEAVELVENYVQFACKAAWWKHDHTHASYTPADEAEQVSIAFEALVEAVMKGGDIKKLINSRLEKDAYARQHRPDLPGELPEYALARTPSVKLVAAEERKELRQKVRVVSNGNVKKGVLCWLFYQNFSDRSFTQKRAAEILDLPESTVSDLLRQIKKAWVEKIGPIPDHVKKKEPKQARDFVKRLLDELIPTGPVEAEFLFLLFQRDHPKDKTSRTKFDKRVKRWRPDAKLVLVNGREHWTNLN
jgi:hypothetical protein